MVARECRDLQRQRRVRQERAQAGAVGTHGLGQDLGIEPVVLASAHRAPVAEALGRLGIDREDDVPRVDQLADQQAASGLDTDGDLQRVGLDLGDRQAQLAHARGVVSDPPTPQHPTIPVDDADVVMVLSPIDAREEDHDAPSLRPAATV